MQLKVIAKLPLETGKSCLITSSGDIISQHTGHVLAKDP